MRKGDSIEMNSRWRPCTGGPSWIITQIDMEGDRVGLSGPGPARSIKYIGFCDLIENWVKITADPTPASSSG